MVSPGVSISRSNDAPRRFRTESYIRSCSQAHPAHAFPLIYPQDDIRVGHNAGN